MAFEWETFLAVARRLNLDTNPATRQASVRSAVSRAYYAAFRTARNYAVEHLKFPPSRLRNDG